MASINEDNLREEESQGGFEPGQPEDDSFMLENQEKYPGELPDFDSGDEPVVIENNEEVQQQDSSDSPEAPDEPASADEDLQGEDVPNEDVEMAEQIDPPAEGGTVWDSFEDEGQSETEEPAEGIDTEGIVTKQEEYVVRPKEDDSPEETIEEMAEPDEQPDANEVTAEEIAEEEAAEENEVMEEDSAAAAEDASAAQQPEVEAETAEIEIPEGLEGLILPTDTQEESIDSIDSIDEATDKVDDDKEGIDREEADEFDETAKEETEEVLDDDFKKALAGDIEKSKLRKDETKAEQPAEDEPGEMKPEDFTPVDDHEEAQLIDINEIEADKPSNYDLQEGSQPPQLKTDEMKIANNAIGPEAMPEEGGVKLKKKKKRKPLPLKRIAILALITIFGAAVAFVGYNYVYQSSEGDVAYADSLAGSEQDSAAHLEKMAVADIDVEADRDAIKEVHKPDAKDTVEVSGKDAGNEAEDIADAAPVKKPKAKQVGKPKPLNKKYIAKAPAKKSKAPVLKAPAKKPVETKDIAKLPAEIKPEKPAQKKIAGTKLPELPLPKSDKGLFTIQIYASPSREDAEEWLNKLRNKKIRDSFISKHEIRNEVWYRVRFGKFETKEEARTTALRYGFAQTWIDRVR